VINLRYHIVSLVAVFLALAVGVLMGSTVLDRGTVALLESSSGQLKGNLDRYRAENEQLRGELGQWRQYGQLILASQVAGRLKDRPVILVDTDQVDDPTREAVRTALREAGAGYDGRITFAADRIALDETGDRNTLAALLQLDDDDPAVLQRALVDKVAARLLAPSAVPSNEKDFPNDALTALRQGNFVADLDLASQFKQSATAFPRPGTLIVVIGPTRVPPIPPADRFLIPLAGRLATGSGAPVTAVEASGPTSWLGALRDNDLVSGRVSSVDNIDLVPGQIALVQALQQGVNGQPPGHYGTKDGATKLLPEEPAK
jgi:hypothetical protein